MPKNKETDQARDSRSQMEEFYTNLKDNAELIVELAPELYEEATNLYGELEDGINRASNIEVAGTTVGDLVSTGYNIVSDIADGTDPTEAVLEHTVGSAVDSFLEEHANYEGTIFDLSYNQTIPVYPPFNAEVGVSASAEASLSTERSGATITCSGNVSATARLSIGMSVGFSVAGYGLSVGAGIQGGPDFSAGVSVSLGASGLDLTGTISPVEIDLSLAAELYFGVSGIPEELIEWVADQLGLKTSGNRILYPLGSVSLVIITTPSYSVTFDMAAGRFKNASAQGEFSAVIHPTLEAAVESVYNSLMNIGTAIAEGIVEVAGDLYEGAVDLTEDAIEATVEFVEDVDEAIDQAGDYITDKAQEIYQTGRQAVQETAEYVQQRFEDVQESLSEVADFGARVVENFSESAQEAYEDVGEFVNTVHNVGREFVGEVSETVTQAAAEVYDTVSNAASDISNSVNSAAESIGNAASDLYESATSWLPS
jgi:vacuolar-type H+-ATPase subunit H